MENYKDIAKIEGHNQVFKMIISNTKDYFIFIFFHDIYMIEDVMNIEFDEMFSVLDSIHNFDNERNKITILDDHAIQGSIIYIKI